MKEGLTKAQQKVIADIQKRANKKYADKLFVKEDNKDILQVFDAMLKRDIPEWKRRFYAATRKDFDAVKEIEDPEVVKQMDEYVTKEIKKAIKAGKLPKPE